ncbi:MAG: GspH/FimT family pseudopilin [Porticoccaceae bacterium]
MKAQNNRNGTRARSQEGMARGNGFTLVELMIVIALMAILIAVAAPSFTQLIKNNRLQTMADTFYTSVILTRSEALARNSPVIMCKSSDGSTCVTTGDWQQGWIVFEDTDRTGDKHATDEPALKRYPAMAAGYTLTTAGSTFQNQLIYRPDGTANSFDTFRVCDPDADVTTGLSITISIVGRPRMSKTVAGCS